MTAEPIPDQSEIRRALDVLHTDPSDVIELRALGVRSRNWPSITSGYFDNRDKLATAAAAISPIARGTYITLNRIAPSLLGRAYNRLRDRDDESEATDDKHVTRRLWLPLDFDPVRPAGIASTDAEIDTARARAYDALADMTADGWGNAVLMASGNGMHVLFPLDLPADDDGYVEDLLAVLAERYSDDQVKLDAVNYNPARIWKLPGTVARKGDHVPQIGRSHRQARLLEMS